MLPIRSLLSRPETSEASAARMKGGISAFGRSDSLDLVVLSGIASAPLAGNSRAAGWRAAIGAVVRVGFVQLLITHAVQMLL